jgi:trehalose/maltose hydrolase-like predicted phosphorylase
MLMYRYHTLPAARAKAAHQGCKGALYAWESADTGEETTPERVVGPDGAMIDILTGRMELHISADIAYAVWQYWRVTGDDDFFLQAGAEILLETARFWASRAVAEADGRRHIRHVIGPDEYHEDVDDNTFTNVMARWNLARGLEAIERCESAGPSKPQHCARSLPLARMSLRTGVMRWNASSLGLMRQPGSMSSSRGSIGSSHSIFRSMPIAKYRSTW